MAEQTLQIIKQGEYAPRPGSRVVIADDVAAAVQSTRLFKPDELAHLLESEPRSNVTQPDITVHNETTLSAARHLVVDRGLDHVLCLNFASAKNPGGGFLGGSQAQEESLARSSALYETLLAAPCYYEANRSCGTCLYTDHMIVCPCVPVFRDDAGDLLDEPYKLSFVTAPAVNAGAVRKNEKNQIDQINEKMRRRIAMVLCLAAHLGYCHLVLGAWGCGVFQNDPAQIAAQFAGHLTHDGRFAKTFQTIVFAVLDRPEAKIITPFQKAFNCVT